MVRFLRIDPMVSGSSPTSAKPSVSVTQAFVLLAVREILSIRLRS